MFPEVRLSRLRRTHALRQFNQEIDLLPRHLIQPIFVSETINVETPVAALPGISQHTVDSAVRNARDAFNAGVSAVILFGIPACKDRVGASASDPSGIVQQTARRIKAELPDLVMIADCCLCEYTDHGHCGVFNHHLEWNNDATLARLAEIAVSYAEAGVDIVAPSGMIDGMVQAIRFGLDHHNHHHVAIMSYSIKYASAFYGPFRHAAGSEGVFVGDRKHHQLPPTQRHEALREADQDIKEGADYIIVKPAQHYTDMIRDLRNQSQIPIVAYQVSGEYVMIKTAAQNGIVDETAAFLEVFHGLRRAGATAIIAYNAVEIATVLNPHSGR